jgi:hypothetical protein
LLISPEKSAVPVKILLIEMLGSKEKISWEQGNDALSYGKSTT